MTIETLGWLGNALFFSRWLVQWHASERARESVSPMSFWWLSLIATGFSGTYTLLQEEPILLAGYLVNVVIYTRNLALATTGRTLRGTALVLAAAFLVSMLVVTLTTRSWNVATPAWVAVGVLGFVVWNGRWPLQWWLSERRGHSHFPSSFWWISLLGTSLQLAYSIHLDNAVWIVGYIPGPLIQARNLMLHYRAQRERGERGTLRPRVEERGEIAGDAPPHAGQGRVVVEQHPAVPIADDAEPTPQVVQVHGHGLVADGLPQGYQDVHPERRVAGPE